MNELVIGGPHRGPSVVTLAFDLAATSASLQDGGVTLEVVEADYDTLSSWLATGRIQLCRRGPDVDVVAAAGGAPVSSCAAVLQAVPADVVVQEGIADASALEGRKVAVIHPTMGSTLAAGAGGARRAPRSVPVLRRAGLHRAAAARRDDIAAYLAAVMDAIDGLASGTMPAGVVAEACGSMLAWQMPSCAGLEAGEPVGVGAAARETVHSPPPPGSGGRCPDACGAGPLVRCHGQQLLEQLHQLLAFVAVEPGEQGGGLAAHRVINLAEGFAAGLGDVHEHAPAVERVAAPAGCGGRPTPRSATTGRGARCTSRTATSCRTCTWPRRMASRSTW